MSTPDLFGGAADKPRGRHYVEPRGYAAPPGTGPAGETCGTCKHAWRAGRFAKCQHPMRRFKNTHGKGTDIRLRSPACQKFELHDRARSRIARPSDPTTERP